MINFKNLKIRLMMNGVSISDEALTILHKTIGEKFYNDDYVTTTGVMIELTEDWYVTVHLNESSEYKIELKSDSLILKENGIELIPIKIWKPSEFMLNNEKNRFGLLTDFVNAHFDRARISPISGCNNHCAFCSMNAIRYRKNSIEAMDAALKVALEDNRITHILISGGSPKNEDLEYLTEVYEYFCKNYSNYEIDVMMTPRGFNSYLDENQYLDYLKYLKKIGVKGLSINLELFNDKICSKYCPEKFKIGRERYFIFLKLANKIFGKENVRSGLIVGLESVEDTLTAVEEICKCGCMPMLSPYIPYNNIGTFPPSDLLMETLNRAETIIKKYNLQLAPLCKKCRHNTL